MSEKRFIYASNEYWVKDNENDVELLPIDVLILLNEQQSTIEKLEWVVDVKQKYIEKLEKRLEDE